MWQESAGVKALSRQEAVKPLFEGVKVKPELQWRPKGNRAVRATQCLSRKLVHMNRRRYCNTQL